MAKTWRPLDVHHALSTHFNQWHGIAGSYACACATAANLRRVLEVWLGGGGGYTGAGVSKHIIRGGARAGVSKHYYRPGQLDFLAYRAGNWFVCFIA